MSEEKLIRKNILNVWSSADEQSVSEGMTWYRDANEYCTRLGAAFNQPTTNVAGVLAALSPGSQWERNKEQTKIALEYFSRGEKLPMLGVYSRDGVIKAQRILAGEAPEEVLGGEKVKNFYYCISNFENSHNVVIDRHAKCLAFGLRSTRAGYASRNTVVTRREYRVLSEQYRSVAFRLGILPHQLQAITWCAWRKKFLASDIPF